MMRLALLASAAVLLLTACVAHRPALPDVATPAQARKAVPFCDVARPDPELPGDPLETIARKAEHNAIGEYLCGWPEPRRGP
ncbi:MAG: hypothetical protein KF895_15405 [Parvibaculum sp.]|nr:hypothetical protein [Parvibaculum sp.]